MAGIEIKTADINYGDRVFLTSRNELIKAMQAYNDDTLANPENYGEIEAGIDCATEQVDNLISYLNK